MESFYRAHHYDGNIAQIADSQFVIGDDGNLAGGVVFAPDYAIVSTAGNVTPTKTAVSLRRGEPK